VLVVLRGVENESSEENVTAVARRKGNKTGLCLSRTPLRSDDLRMFEVRRSSDREVNGGSEKIQ
jgi:hypothetical protein